MVDPWTGASIAAQVDLLTARGIRAEIGPHGPYVDLQRAGLCLLTQHGPEGAKSLDALEGQHGKVPGAPRWLDDASRRVSLHMAPPGLVDAINLHGTAPGLSVIARGVILLPPSAAVGSAGLRWNGRDHPSHTPLRALPQWLVDAAADPIAAHRAWDTAGKTSAAKAVIDEWQKALTWERGKIAKTHGNLCTILRASPSWSGRITYHEMLSAPCLDGQPLTTGVAGAIRERIERELGAPFGEDALWSAFATVSDERRVHPVRDYLRALVWDGTPRLDAVASNILGSVGALESVMVRRWFLSAAARALTPGCQVDTSLVLVGDQGALKSKFFATLAGEWFSDTHVDLSSKDALIQLAGAWIVEWGEFERVTSRKGSDEIKAFMSSRCDRYRPPYGRSVVSVPRACVIVGSTNQSTFLDDDTGSRRFWCVRVPGRIDIPALIAHRDQMWAEAVHLVGTGAQWWLDADEDIRRESDAAVHTVEDPWHVTIQTWLALHELRVHTAAEILTGALDVPKKDHTKAATLRLARVLRGLGCERRKVRRGPTTVWAWVDTTDAHEEAMPPEDFEPA